MKSRNAHAHGVAEGAGAVPAKSRRGAGPLPAVLIEAEGFAEKGGWVVDSQFMDQMGSPFLLAHGCGRPVADAVTKAEIPAGATQVWVRTRDWVAPHGPGRFTVSIGAWTSRPLGVGEGAWHWEKAGVLPASGPCEVRLHDLTGFEGRVDAIFVGAEGARPPETWPERRRLLGLPEKAPDAGRYQFVVVGGGYAGVCAAVAAARQGVRTAILQDRPVFGGNGSGEVRVGPIGKLDLGPFPRNSDLMHEIDRVSRGSGRTSGGVRPKPDDDRLLQWMLREDSLSVFPSTRCVDAERNADGTIRAVVGRHVETGRELRFPAEFFCDATGDAGLALRAGAEVRTAPELQEETGETLAVKRNGTPGGFGSTNYWMAKWTDRPTKFPRCPWAHDVTAESVDVSRPRWPVETDRPFVAGWNWESGFGRDAVEDGEWIRDNNFRAAFGTWDYYKNKAADRAAYAKAEIEWMGHVTGRRDARRIVGDHVLTEQDLTGRRVYPDGVVTATWYLDMHFAHPQNERHFPGCAFRSCAYDDPRWAELGVENDGKMTPIKPYPIPFRCFYSKTVPNLFMAGKDISVTHVALSSVRVENTTAQMGTMVGRAVSLCLRHGWSPRELGRDHFEDLRRLLANPRREVWLFLAGPDLPDAPLVAASVAWLAEASGALCDSYLESRRDGRLFAATGSTVLSGRHFQDLNYLAARADVKIVRYGRTSLFDSTADALGLATVASGQTPAEVYEQILETRPRAIREVRGYVRAPDLPRDFAPYAYPEIAYGRKLYLGADDPRVGCLERPRGRPLGEERIALGAKETLADFTKRISRKWKAAAKSVFFGDPAALAWRVPAEIRRRSVPVFAPCVRHDQRETHFSSYAEDGSPLADYAADLAVSLGDRVLYGRQTTDGDIFRWARKGCPIQIVDPCRPVFPCVEQFPQYWKADAEPAGDEPTDEQLRAWAEEGKILTTLLWHSGEIAHNEAMLNVIEFAQLHDFRMGVAVHAQRYETCPQLWELLRVGVDRGGARELVEPVLHAGALGVTAEADFPPEQLRRNILEARRRIAIVAGDRQVPKGYYAFMDSDLETLTRENPAVWEAARSAGMEYFVTCCRPGRPRVFRKDGMTVINQTFRTVETSSPFVRIANRRDLQRGPGVSGPGWRIGVLDAPVVAFQPHIWEGGREFVELARELETGRKGGRYLNVKPCVIARYAKILDDLGLLAERSSQ